MKGEEALIRLACGTLPKSERTLIGPGDDCAMLTGFPAQLIAADQVIGDIHFTMETPPEVVAAKLLRRNLSDIAAMGGSPTHAVETVAIRLESRASETRWLEKFFEGLATEARRWQISICGGDISTLPNPGIVASLTILGEVNEQNVARRSGARPGDLLFVTGELGNSFASGHHLNFLPRLGEGMFLCDRRFATAMIDISDGLLTDLMRLCHASRCGVELDPAALPLRHGATIQNAYNDGEDYELLFAVYPDRAEELMNLWPFTRVRLTQIGKFTNTKPAIHTPVGETLQPAGWDPF